MSGSCFTERPLIPEILVSFQVSAVCLSEEDPETADEHSLLLLLQILVDPWLVGDLTFGSEILGFLYKGHRPDGAGTGPRENFNFFPGF